MEHLTLEERYKISALLELKTPKKEIAEQLGRDRSTIYREVRRNADNRSGKYNAELAQRKAQKRHKDKAKHKVFTPSMEKLVCDGLQDHLSPEQIKGRAMLEGTPCVSHERIYQFIWQDKKAGGRTYLCLRNKGRKYQKRGGKQAGRGCIPNRRDITERPRVVDKKERIGDLEIDLVIGKDHRGALVTINDRATGMLRMGHIENKSAREVQVKTEELLEDWKPFIKTITSDNGKEFANHQEIAEELDIDFYFAKPYHSWQRGANENLNGLIRQYFPKGSSFAEITKEAVEKVENILNNRPRKRFGYKTPNEVYATFINKTQTVAFIT
ncbi:IS30 family transposase [Aquimarina sp. ERC-38]|uniref:IS30 family transposase n=1 Tax=Aquimarina sp. ERC-38 TaxID=2949996 RepID=UPI00224714C1|nr:IS30 family transposase [Aquimarina sp. ERC-38]UZO82106.1 IS30 family transposase [Aquimarina sp. ERC-38]